MAETLIISKHITPRIGITLLMFLISACSLLPSAPSVEEQTEKLAGVLAKGAYKPITKFQIQNIQDVWLHNQSELEISLTAPSETGSYPLIIYLPGLGEDAKAGRFWREAWAKAGYVVFSIQALKTAKALKALESKQGEDKILDDTDALPPDEVDFELPAADERLSLSKDRRRNSRSARNSELRYLGHEYFAVENLQNRLQQLFWAYQQFKIRASTHQPLYASADLSRVVLAGYELGSQTVSAIAGEHFDTDLPRDKDLKPVAAILLSPPVDVATGNMHSRFQALNLPILVITGSEDNDPYTISSASARTGIWDYAPTGDKYLLLLQGAGHRLLSGSEMGGRFSQERSGGWLGSAFTHDSDSNHGSRSGNRSTTDPLSPPEGIIDDSYERNRKNETIGYKHVAAVMSVSSAFLDMLLKRDEFAQSWLSEKANPWLGRVGSLKSK